jgi:hypothetical protein
LRYLHSLWFICLFLIFSFPAASQDINKYVSVSPPATWIDKHIAPKAEFILGKDDETNYLLVDQQNRFSRSQQEYYRHYADKLRSPNSVEDNSAIKISFDPAYQIVKIHHIRRIRGDDVKDILNLSEFDIYRMETDRDKLIYNGNLQISYVVPDVRVGDTLDYAYTISGKNPAIGPHFSTSFQHQWGSPVQRLYQRLLVSTDTAVYLKSHAGATPPAHTTLDGYNIYLWDIKDQTLTTAEGGTPSGYQSYPKTQLSSFENWAEVGAYFAPFYATPETITGPIKKIAADIKSKSTDPSVQLRQALDFVQREVRYLGIELGAGGYIPRQPDAVLTRRFGDCKDMVRLLITILSELGIEAAPLLVNLNHNGRVADSIPSYGAFDHVIVSSTVQGKQYFLDPTRGQQLGDLAHLQQGDFKKGVIIAANSPGMIDASAPPPDFLKDIVDTYDVTSDPDTVSLTTVSSYFMGQADSILAWYKSSGHKAVEKSYLEYFQSLYPTLEQVGPIKFETFEDLGKVSITVRYKIPNAWAKTAQANAKEFSSYEEDVRQDIPKFIGARRNTPYSIAHPARTRQTLKFILDDTWELKGEKEQYSFNALDFSKISTFENNIYTRVSNYTTKADNIAPEDFRKTMSAIKIIRETSGVTLTMTTNDALVELPAETGFFETLDWELVFYGWVLFAGISALIVGIRCRNDDAQWRERQIFYPVAMIKFIPLSIVSFGIYQIYWIYKNWLWLLNVEDQEISPAWRTFFSTIMNFSLFGRMNRADMPGFKWFKFAATPLAILYFVGEVISRISDKWEEAPMWLDALSLATVFILIPVAMHVNKMNECREEYIAKNSAYGWPAWGMLVMFLPILAIGLWGLFLI